MTQRSLEGRTALVTGALRGIGRAVAERFAAEGATVVLTDLSPPTDEIAVAVLREIGGGARYLQLDVGDEQAHRVRADVDRSDSHVAVRLSFNLVSNGKRRAQRSGRAVDSGNGPTIP